MRVEKFKEILNAFLEENPELKRNKGLGYCGRAVIALRKTLNDRYLRPFVLYGTEFSDNAEGQKAKQGLIETLQEVKSKLKTAEYKQIEDLYLNSSDELNSKVSHIVLVCNSWILDPTATQFKLPYVYSTAQFFKTWKSADTADDIAMTDKFTTYQVIKHDPLRVRRL